MTKLRAANLASYLIFFPIMFVGQGAAHAKDTFVYGKLGSSAALGIGMVLNENLSLRGGVGSDYAVANDRDSNGNHYNIKPESNTSVNAMLDWFPLAGSGFRVSGGVAYGNKQIHNLTATPDAVGNYHLNGSTYSATDVGQLRGHSTFSKFTPQIELGWESAPAKKPGWRFISDINMQFKNVRTTTLSATGATSNAALSYDVAAEQKRVSSDFGGRQFRLGVSVGAAYSF